MIHATTLTCCFSPHLVATHIIVLAVHTLADFCTEDGPLEALAVLLQAGRLLAVAALGVAYCAIRSVTDALGVRVTLGRLSRQQPTGNRSARAASKEALGMPVWVLSQHQAVCGELYYQQTSLWSTTLHPMLLLTHNACSSLVSWA